MNYSVYDRGEADMSLKKSQRQKLVILGAGSFAPEVLDLIEETGEYTATAFVESQDRSKTEKPLLGLPVMWIDETAGLVATHLAVSSLGTTRRKKFIEQISQRGFSFATIIHPSVSLSTKSSVGEGSLLSRGVIVAAYADIGKHVLVNRGSLIGHHTKIGDYVTISPGVNVAGYVNIGEGTYIGMGAIILDHITIGVHTVIGSGAVVVNDVPDRVQVMGIPARITKENIG